MHEVLVNRLGGLSLPRKSVVRLTDRPDMTLDVYRGRKTTTQQQLVETIFLYRVSWVGSEIELCKVFRISLLTFEADPVCYFKALFFCTLCFRFVL